MERIVKKRDLLLESILHTTEGPLLRSEENYKLRVHGRPSVCVSKTRYLSSFWGGLRTRQLLRLEVFC